MFNFVIDVNEKGAKGKPFKMTFDKLSDEIDLSYDVDIGDGIAPNMH